MFNNDPIVICKKKECKKKIKMQRMQNKTVDGVLCKTK